MTDSGRRSRLLGWGWWLSYPIIFQMSLTAIAAPIKLKLPPPPSRGIAGNRSAAASRDTCPTVAQPLTALVPEYRSPQPNRVWGLTGMERPTFWFYIPYPKSSIASISFTLQDESNPADTKINLGIAIEVSASDNLDCAMVYSPGSNADFFCFEPVCHTVDAHNQPGQPGLQVLDKGETFTMSMNISWVPLEMQR